MHRQDDPLCLMIISQDLSQPCNPYKCKEDDDDDGNDDNNNINKNNNNKLSCQNYTPKIGQ